MSTRNFSRPGAHLRHETANAGPWCNERTLFFTESVGKVFWLFAAHGAHTIHMEPKPFAATSAQPKNQYAGYRGTGTQNINYPVAVPLSSVSHTKMASIFTDGIRRRHFIHFSCRRRFSIHFPYSYRKANRTDRLTLTEQKNRHRYGGEARSAILR